MYGLNGCKALPADNVLGIFSVSRPVSVKFNRPAWLTKGITFLVAKTGMVMSRVIEHLKVDFFVVVPVVTVEGHAVSSKTMPCDIINSKNE